MPARALKSRYRVPMSLWFVENSHWLMKVTGKMAECLGVRL